MYYNFNNLLTFFKFNYKLYKEKWTYFKSRLIILFDAEVLFLRLPLSQDPDRPFAECRLIGQCVVEADSSKVGLISIIIDYNQLLVTKKFS